MKLHQVREFVKADDRLYWWYVGEDSGVPSRRCSIDAASWQLKKIWDDPTVVDCRVNRNPKLLKLIESHERCEQRRFNRVYMIGGIGVGSLAAAMPFIERWRKRKGM